MNFNQPKQNSEEIMKNCNKRLLTDPNYNKDHYQMDNVRYNILKMEPETTPKPKTTANTQNFDLKQQNSNFNIDESVDDFDFDFGLDSDF